MRRRRERSVHGQTVNPDAYESRRGRSVHDVGHTIGGNQSPARLAQPRRGRLPATAPGNAACRKTTPGPRFDCVSSRWPQQQRRRAPPAGPRASRRPPRSAAATQAPRQSRSGGVTRYGDAGQLPWGVQNRPAPSPAPTSTPKPSSRSSPRPSRSGASTTPDKARSPLGSGEGDLWAHAQLSRRPACRSCPVSAAR